MKREDIQKMARDIIESGAVESDYIEYKKSASGRDTILKTACAFCNNYMNREIGLIFIGVEEVDDKENGIKAVPKRPISGVDDEKIESTENSIKSLLSNITPVPKYHLLQDEIDGRTYIIIAVEPGNDGPPFRDPLSPKGVSLVLWRKVYAKSSVQIEQRKPDEWLTPQGGKGMRKGEREGRT